jgi:ABC-2 type transport system permease protein
LILGSFFGISLSVGQWLVTGFAMLLNALALTGLGFIVAWRLQSIQGFHAIMNLFLMPLWFLSGALFPPEGAPAWIQAIMKLNPLSYGMALLRMSIYGIQAKPAGFPGVVGSTFLTVTFAAALFVLASILASQRRVEDLA